MADFSSSQGTREGVGSNARCRGTVPFAIARSMSVETASSDLQQLMTWNTLEKRFQLAVITLLTDSFVEMHFFLNCFLFYFLDDK